MAQVTTSLTLTAQLSRLLGAWIKAAESFSRKSWSISHPPRNNLSPAHTEPAPTRPGRILSSRSSGFALSSSSTRGRFRPPLVGGTAYHNSDISHKLVILVDTAGERPLLENLFESSRKTFKHDVAVVIEAGLLALLDLFFIKLRKLPTHDQPLYAILKTSRTFETIQRGDWAARPDKPITRRD
jgi:hypothetical protein